MPIERITDEEIERAPKVPPKFPHARQVLRLFRNYIPVWNLNKPFLSAAEWLFKEKGMEELVELMDWYEEHKNDKYCPHFDNPMELVVKYSKLEEHLTRSS